MKSGGKETQKLHRQASLIDTTTLHYKKSAQKTDEPTSKNKEGNQQHLSRLRKQKDIQQARPNPEQAIFSQMDQTNLNRAFQIGRRVQHMWRRWPSLPCSTMPQWLPTRSIMNTHWPSFKGPRSLETVLFSPSTNFRGSNILSTVLQDLAKAFLVVALSWLAATRLFHGPYGRQNNSWLPIAWCYSYTKVANTFCKGVTLCHSPLSPRCQRHPLRG